MRLPLTVGAFGSASFEQIFKQEVEALDPHCLPLQQGLSQGGCVAERAPQVMLISASRAGDHLNIRAGVFYAGVIAGCNCADDPTPVDETTEYCVLELVVNMPTAAAQVTLGAD